LFCSYTIKTEVYLTFWAAIEPAAYDLPQALQGIDKSTINSHGYFSINFKKQGVETTNTRNVEIVKSGGLRGWGFFRICVS
jgi:hypothetical protein